MFAFTRQLLQRGVVDICINLEYHHTHHYLLKYGIIFKYIFYHWRKLNVKISPLIADVCISVFDG